MNSFHSDGGYVTPNMVSFAGLESTSSSNGNQKPQQQQMWDWEPTAAQTHHAADLHHQPPLFTASPVNSSPYSFPLMGIGSGGGYPFHSIVAEDYPAALIKNEDDRGVGQIGLNLGRRTYFPSGEAAAIEQLFRRSRGIYQVGQQATRCQAEGCKADLSVAKHYHRRHKVCELHSKATVVVAGGMQQRFCQQCSRFHPLSEFDEAKRSCRKRLAEHNRRRRKSQSSPTMSTAGSDRSNPTDSSISSMDRSRLPSSNPTRNDAAAAKHLIPRPATSASTISGISQNNASLDNHKTAAHLWNGPSLSLGGGGSAAAVSEKGSGFGFLSHYSPQMPSWVFVSDDNNNTSGSQPSSSSSSSLFLHSPALFCNTPTEASQSVSTLAETNLLQLGQGLLEVDFI